MPPVTVEDEPTDPELEFPVEGSDELQEDAGELTQADVQEIVLYTLDWSVQSLLERIGSTFDINPAFQRRDAWDRGRKSLYIESLIAGLPVPQIVLAEDRDARGRFIVLDGKQRLVTMKQFASPTEHFRQFKLRGLQFLPHLENLSFEQIRDTSDLASYSEAFLAQPVRTIVVRNWRRIEVLYHIFVRLNQGSVSLSPQELRQALFPGEFTRWIGARSATSSAIQRARRLKREDFRMRDAEMLLRYLAFARSIDEYNGNLRAFLDDACVQGNLHWKNEADGFLHLADRCEASIGRVFEAFGDDAYLRFDGTRYVRRFNVALFDAMSLVFSDPTIEGKDTLPQDQLVRAFQELSTSNEEFQQSLVTTTKTTRATIGRVYWLAHAIGDALGDELLLAKRLKPLASQLSL